MHPQRPHYRPVAKTAMIARCNSRSSRSPACAALTAALLLTTAQPATAQPAWVLSHQKISDAEGGFTGTLDNDVFGVSVALLGDLDGDGADSPAKTA